MTYDPTPQHVPDQPDPLAGRDPFPRHEIDVLALHDARRDLLEEIVSTPGASSPTTSTGRALVAVGIAAALLLVLGGAWFATGGIGSGDDPTVASGPTADATVDEAVPDDESSAPTAPDEPVEPDDSDVRVDGVEVGRVVPLHKCRLLLEDDRPLTLKRLQRLDLRIDGRKAPPYVKLQRRGDARLFFIAGDDRRAIALDKACRIVWAERLGQRD